MITVKLRFALKMADIDRPIVICDGLVKLTEG